MGRSPLSGTIRSYHRANSGKGFPENSKRPCFDVWRKILAESLTNACLEEQFRLIAFVFIPEHVHLLVLPENPQSNVSRLLART